MTDEVGGAGRRRAVGAADHRRALGAAFTAVAATVLAAGEVASFGVGDAFRVDEIANLAAIAVFLAVGGLVTYRRPDNPVGWLLVATVVLYAGAGLAEALADRWVLGGRRDHWYVPMLGTFAFAGLGVPLATLLMLFPTGRLVSPRWRWLPALLAVVMLVAAFGTTTAPWFTLRPVAPSGRELEVLLHNPWGSASWVAPVRAIVKPAELLGLVLAAGVVVHLVVRFRRSSGIERLQLRWLVYTLVTTLTVVPLLGQLVTAVAGSQVGEAYGAIAFGAVLASLPVGIGIAVLRYRLFEIDRLVSRTLGYAVVTAVLGGVYASGVLGVGELVPREGNDLVVAGSTLAVAALFQPVRRRVQAVVDRRFNRARYDAQVEVAAFTSRLRQEVDLGVLVAELGTVVSSTVAPANMSLWLPQPVVRS